MTHGSAPDMDSSIIFPDGDDIVTITDTDGVAVTGTLTQMTPQFVSIQRPGDLFSYVVPTLRIASMRVHLSDT